MTQNVNICLCSLRKNLACKGLSFNIADNFGIMTAVGGAARFLVVGTIGKEERPPQGQLWMEQHLISLKYWPI